MNRVGNLYLQLALVFVISQEGGQIITDLQKQEARKRLCPLKKIADLLFSYLLPGQQTSEGLITLNYTNNLFCLLMTAFQQVKIICSPEHTVHTYHRHQLGEWLSAHRPVQTLMI